MSRLRTQHNAFGKSRTSDPPKISKYFRNLTFFFLAKVFAKAVSKSSSSSSEEYCNKKLLTISTLNHMKRYIASFSRQPDSSVGSVFSSE